MHSSPVDVGDGMFTDPGQSVFGMDTVRDYAGRGVVASGTKGVLAIRGASG